MNAAKKFLISFGIFVALCYAGLTWFVHHEVRKGIDQAVADTPGLLLSYDGLSVSIRHHAVSLEGVDATLPTGQHFTAKEVRILEFDQKNPTPHFMAVEAKGVVMAPTRENFGSWAGVMAGTGEDSVTGDVGFAYEWTPGDGALRVKSLDVTADGLFDLSMSGTVDHLDLAAFRMEELIGLRLVRTDLTLANHAFVDILLRDAAKGMRVTTAQVRAQTVAELEAMERHASGRDNSVAAQAVAGLKAFVQSPGTLRVRALPEEPVPLLYFFMGRDFYDNLELLGASVSTTPKDNN